MIKFDTSMPATVCEYDGFSGLVSVEFMAHGIARPLNFEARSFFGNRIPRIGDSLKMEVDYVAGATPKVISAEFV